MSNEIQVTTNEMNADAQVSVNVEQPKAKRGRPVVANSERQKRLAKYAAKEAAGIPVKRGRPVDSSSERQQRLAERQAKLAIVGELKRGRPVDPSSERQKRLAAKVTAADTASLDNAASALLGDE